MIKMIPQKWELYVITIKNEKGKSLSSLINFLCLTSFSWYFQLLFCVFYSNFESKFKQPENNNKIRIGCGNFPRHPSKTYCVYQTYNSRKASELWRNGKIEHATSSEPLKNSCQNLLSWELVIWIKISWVRLENWYLVEYRSILSKTDQ
jgi:hypothetical protein